MIIPNSIKYIIYKIKNSEHMRKANQCNNIFLASLCFINISGKINLKEFFKKKIKKIGSKKIH